MRAVTSPTTSSGGSSAVLVREVGKTRLVNEDHDTDAIGMVDESCATMKRLLG